VWEARPGDSKAMVYDGRGSWFLTDKSNIESGCQGGFLKQTGQAAASGPVELDTANWTEGDGNGFWEPNGAVRLSSCVVPSGWVQSERSQNAVSHASGVSDKTLRTAVLIAFEPYRRCYNDKTQTWANQDHEEVARTAALIGDIPLSSLECWASQDCLELRGVEYVLRDD
jgi:hypothetical protein